MHTNDHDLVKGQILISEVLKKDYDNAGKSKKASRRAWRDGGPLGREMVDL